MIEYRIRPVTRFIVTRHEDNNSTGNNSQHGEFDNEEIAYQVGYALCRADHERLGYPLADERIKYPSRPSEATATAVKSEAQCG